MIPIKAIRVPNVGGRKGRYGIGNYSIFASAREGESLSLPWNGKTLGHDASNLPDPRKKNAPKNKTFGLQAESMSIECSKSPPNANVNRPWMILVPRLFKAHTH